MSIGTRASGAGKRARRRELPKRGFTLQNLSVSSRLIAVIVLALIMGLVFGSLRVADAVGSADQFGHIARLAGLGEQVTIFTQDLQNERDETAAVIGGANPAVLKPLYSATEAEAAQMTGVANNLGGGIPANIASTISTVVADAQNLGAVRSLARAESNPTLVITDYSGPISDMTALTSEIAQGVSDAALSNDVRTLDSISAAKEQATEQRALLFNALTQGFFGIGVQTAVNAAAAQQQLDEAAFQTTATPAQQAAFAQVSGSSQASEAANVESFLLTDSDPFTDVVNLGINQQKSAATWYSLMSAEINQMQGTELGIADDIVARAASVQDSATRAAQVSAVITGVVLFIVLLAALLVARSIVLPLRRLRAGALDVASVQLPERVRQLSESPDPAADLEVAPIPVLSGDEIGEVARAFDQVHAEAVRLAGNEALLRTAFNAMFVNLSRRSQSLIERLARMIESQEQNEDDPDRLSNLFSMDHLVTRMRRNSENLLLLAGHESPRKWTQPVAMADVTRAASAEIEQYSRVVLNVPPGVAVVGPAVSDVVHLLAELIENATIFSPKETPVQVSAQELTSGGVLIEVTDKGIGVSESRLAEMNWRLDNPPVMDVSVSRHMGLFAVARLAERHGIRIRLRPATPQGLTALVWLPDRVIEKSALAFRGTGSWQSATQDGHLEPRRPSGQHSIVAAARQDASGKHSIVRPGDSAVAQDGQGSVAVPAPVSQPTSNWFRSRHTALGAQARMPANSAGNEYGNGNGEAAVGAVPNISGWQPGWGAVGAGTQGTGGRRPADIVADPVQGDQTAAGLPLRVPRANLIPGSAPGIRNGGGTSGGDGLAASRLGGSSNEMQTLSAPLPQRSPDMARSRLSGFQRGARRADSQEPRAGEGTDS